MGINCDQCVEGYYRPFGVDKAARDACRRKILDIKLHLINFIRH